MSATSRRHSDTEILQALALSNARMRGANTQAVTLGPQWACDKCGAPATFMGADLREIEPVLDEANKLWARWAYDGEPHYRCSRHPYKPKTTYQNGETFGGYDA